MDPGVLEEIDCAIGTILWEADQCTNTEPHWPHLWARGQGPTHECVGRAPGDDKKMPPRRGVATEG